ncbi:DNA-3-methyladenine glycosylase [candidate division WWE3 bacterium RIFOXYC1_FULL_39_7]|uniref:DNA-3-methyladenine glycosylase n=2 Tax=Katanobacteria TaxID=422282 RepID=A0A1F4X383_UNCKA|nr:MAG: DNA-3-methyladenine glycosylase [candidate division WWE3 bacterium RIFOXYC1_FULL_39_7]OGC76162.1 MAG: DNA-3-methyladenine glycosylase [candidate division WWE3 bacterium RIFOXYD1_FULL_39_9]
MSNYRCQWAENPIFHDYHDTEWGVPVHDDKKQFEFLILESAQAGLSWSTILKKREGYKKAFANFDPVKVAKFTQKDVEKLLLNPEIIRNRLKVNAAINNAQRFLEIQKEFGSFDKYIWGFVGGKTIDNKIKSMSEIKATSKESDALSKDLIKRGFKFVGSTIIYAHMQAVGMVNDHEVKCYRH